MIIPQRIPAGVTLDVSTTQVAYPAPEWTLTLHMRGPLPINVTAAADGVSHRFAVAASVTEEWVAGRYWYVIRATDGDVVVDIETGDVEVLVDLAQLGGDYDGRDHARRMLDAIEAVLEGRATKDQQSYRIADRELVRTPVGDLLRLRSVYRAEVSQLDAAASGRSALGRPVRVRFTH